MQMHVLLILWESIGLTFLYRVYPVPGVCVGPKRYATVEIHYRDSNCSVKAAIT